MAIEHANRSGVYAITNSRDGKMYVGSAVRFAQRWRQHRKHLRAHAHHSIKLQRAWEKHGPDSFEFRPLLICAKEHLLLYEQLAIDALGATTHGYNVSPTAGNCLGVKHTAATRAKISRIRTGMTYPPMSDAQKEKLRAGRLGKKHTPEHNAKIAAAGRGRVQSDATKEKLRQLKLGRPLSADHIAKAQAGQMKEAAREKSRNGRKRKYGPMSEAQKAKISAAMKSHCADVRARALTG